MVEERAYVVAARHAVSAKMPQGISEQNVGGAEVFKLQNSLDDGVNESP